MRSGEDRTLLMISAASGDKMAFKTCVESLRMVLNPHEVNVSKTLATESMSEVLVQARLHVPVLVFEQPTGE